MRQNGPGGVPRCDVCLNFREDMSREWDVTNWAQRNGFYEIAYRHCTLFRHNVVVRICPVRLNVTGRKSYQPEVPKC